MDWGCRQRAWRGAPKRGPPPRPRLLPTRQHLHTVSWWAVALQVVGMLVRPAGGLGGCLLLRTGRGRGRGARQEDARADRRALGLSVTACFTVQTRRSCWLAQARRSSQRRAALTEGTCLGVPAAHVVHAVCRAS